jgi:hypothetical protein
VPILPKSFLSKKQGVGKSEIGKMCFVPSLPQTEKRYVGTQESVILRRIRKRQIRQGTDQAMLVGKAQRVRRISEKNRVAGMKTSKLMGRTEEKLEAAACLLHTIKTELDKTEVILNEVKQGPVWDIEPVYKQEELFSFVVLPEENETLARLCLDSLVETI